MKSLAEITDSVWLSGWRALLDPPPDKSAAETAEKIIGEAGSNVGVCRLARLLLARAHNLLCARKYRGCWSLPEEADQYMMRFVKVKLQRGYHDGTDLRWTDKDDSQLIAQE